MLAAERVPAGVVYQTQLAARLGQPGVGVVFSQLQSVLGAAGEHAVRLVHAFADQVIHQHANVGLVPPGQPGVAGPLCARTGLQSGVHPGKQALRGSFLVTGGAIDLPGEKQATNLPRLEAALERARVKVVVLNGVTGPQNVGVFQPLHAAHQRKLDIKWQAGGNAIGVVLVGRQSLGLEKNLVAFFVGKAVHFVLHAGAVARAHALDLSGEHGAAVQAAADDGMRLRIGMRDPAGHLRRVLAGAAHETEHRQLRAHATRHAVARLFQAAGEVDAAAVNAWRRPRFQSALWQLEFFQSRTQAACRRVACTACAVVVQADMDLAVQKSSRRQHHGFGAKRDADLRHRAHDPIALQQQIINRLLKQAQVGLVFQHAPDRGFVQNPVRLGAGGAHGRAFAGIENTELDAGLVSSQGHRATQGVHLFDQMALANPANRRVATHLPQGFDVVGQQQGFAPHARGRQGRLGAGMAATDNDDIKMFRVQHGVLGVVGRLGSKGNFTGGPCAWRAAGSLPLRIQGAS